MSSGCPFQAPGRLLPAPNHCQHLPGHCSEIYIFFPNKNVLSRELAFRKKRFSSQENLCRAVFCDQTPTSTTVDGLGFGKDDLALVTVPGVGCVLPSLEFDRTPDSTEPNLGAQWPGVLVSWGHSILRFVGGWDAPSSVETDVLGTLGRVSLGGLLYTVSQ